MTTTLNFDLGTAIITPFTRDNQVDYAALERVANHLIETGTDAIVVNGSTGENPTVSTAEKLEIIRAVKSVIGARPVTLIAGSATNDTETTIALSKASFEAGADGLLVVVPYYNKPSQKGMLAHFGAVAQAVDAPIIIYNIPGRSVVTMEPATMATLAELHPNLVGVKQSCPDMDAVSDIIRKTPAEFALWSGDDSLTLPMMALGATGVVSVAAHVVGRPMRSMVDAFKAGNVDKARQIHLSLMDVFREIFFLPNPTVVKACLARMGLIDPYLRLPLVEADGAESDRIDRLFEQIQAINLSPALA